MTNMQFLYEVNWGGAVIRIPWRLYRTYGDTRTMARYYDNMVAWMDFLAIKPLIKAIYRD